MNNSTFHSSINRNFYPLTEYIPNPENIYFAQPYINMNMQPVYNANPYNSNSIMQVSAPLYQPIISQSAHPYDQTSIEPTYNTPTQQLYLNSSNYMQNNCIYYYP